MLTMSRVLSFWSTKLRVDWDLAFSHVRGISIEDNGVLFQNKAGMERDRFVYISDPRSKAWFFNKVEQCVKSSSYDVLISLIISSEWLRLTTLTGTSRQTNK